MIEYKGHTFDVVENYIEWVPWISEMHSMMDGMGAFVGKPYHYALKLNPWLDMMIYKIIHNKWIALTDKSR